MRTTVARECVNSVEATGGTRPATADGTIRGDGIDGGHDGATEYDLTVRDSPSTPKTARSLGFSSRSVADRRRDSREKLLLL
ncbi:hypothetical protein C493_04668 [Natronolimnohabitans innermongolicus JCM 12255]|uniref:Uncharacterized protein n=1 Tax=Natronolimnohabitans innermongolicus JCM 12255 TaxID=1227499 RepID=L9XE81_9EURY|nr:hypothetical protein C493_04668 [Natronolimnohabitans innermongolicus JCM 12255]